MATAAATILIALCRLLLRSACVTLRRLPAVRPILSNPEQAYT
jgi:hypothetical protein